MPGIICSMESYPHPLPAVLFPLTGPPDLPPDSLPVHPDRLPDTFPNAIDNLTDAFPNTIHSLTEGPDQLTDHLDRLPDPIVLVILNRVADVKSLGRCAALSRRFRSLVPLVHRVHLPVDCVLPDDPSSPSSAARDRPRAAAAFFSHLMHALTHLLLPSSSSRQILSSSSSAADSQISHHSPDEVLRSFKELRQLEIVLPDGELGLDDGVLLRWRAGFGSTLETCVILGASSISTKPQNPNPNPCNKSVEEDMISNAILKHRVIWTISALIAASSRHYLLAKIVSGHETLEQLELSDRDGQGVLTMDKKQLQDFRSNPVPASCGALRTVVPALSVKLWYAPALDLPGSSGTRLEGATLVAIRPSGTEDPAGDWVLDAFEEPYRSAVRMLVARRNYRIEMNSF